MLKRVLLFCIVFAPIYLALFLLREYDMINRYLYGTLILSHTFFTPLFFMKYYEKKDKNK